MSPELSVLLALQPAIFFKLNWSNIERNKEKLKHKISFEYHNVIEILFK